MNERVCFRSPAIRAGFFEEAKKQAGFETWAEFYDFCGKRKNMMERYRFGELTLPLITFEKLYNRFPKGLQEFFKSKISYKDENWGRIKGGVIAYKKHRHILEEGRAIARSIKIRKCKYSFDENIPVSIELAEFMGCLIGDGFTNKYNRTAQIQFAGDSRFDRKYYDTIIIPIACKLFNFKRAYIRVEDNSLWVNFNLNAKKSIT